MLFNTSGMGEAWQEYAIANRGRRQLPYLVGNVVELLDLDPTAESSEEGANIDLDATRVGKSAVIKTSTRQTIFLPLIGLVDSDKLKPGDLIGVNKDSYLILDTLPAEYDSRVKAMEVDEKPTEQYTDVGGLDKQIEELVEAIVWPMKEADRFKKIGIKAPKGKCTASPYARPVRRLSNSCPHPEMPAKCPQTMSGQMFADQVCRRVDVRASWDRQDAASEGLCSPDGCHVLEAGRTPACSNVHR